MAGIKIKSAEEIEPIRKACEIVAWVLERIGREIKPGVTTEYLDSFAERLIRERGAVPVFIGYRGYRHATCISINEEIVHGIPAKRALQEGDIVGVDVGAKIDGYCGDSAATFPVGRVSKKAEKLIRTCRAALKAAIRQARAGNHLGDISFSIQRVAEAEGYSVVRELYGHGIGKDLHEDPLIPNFGRPGEGPELKSGMTLAIEPMLNLGGWKIKTLEDGWTVVTEDRSLSCHFEHTVLVGKGEAEVLTKR
ncbi:methionine aminopeptidase [candidate division WOR-1 bacterium DG_54_3]|uniref:Methionine aminopeptidase n=1 Tax=candidate division WOR-1 bacterium DG_54_3 TaxID=1703775 RepID=A0A0S7Y6X5_UNCSA|nr:MAG: methionine aminopeptidase [candidate division WOR-1 bacterium DG_54_3]